MQPAPARLLFALLAVVFGSLAAVTGNFIFGLVAVLAGLLLAASLATSRVPLTRALGLFRGQRVELLLWGASPPGTSGAPLVLASVNIIGAGIHVFFDVSSGRPMHLKIAQPGKSTLTRDRVVITTARYVQWNSAKLKPVAGAPAVSFLLVTSGAAAADHAHHG